MKLGKALAILIIAISLLGVSNLTNSEASVGMPECLSRLLHATSIDEDARGQIPTVTENHKAYVDASNIIYALEVKDLNYVLEHGSPAGRIYAAVLLKQSSKVGNNLSFDKLLADKDKVIYKSNDKVIHTTVAEVARSFIDKGAYENFSFAIFCKMISEPSSTTKETNRESRVAVNDPRSENMIKIARKSLVGKVTIPKDTKVTVHTEERQVIVTFGEPPPHGVRGADYLARVVINSRTANVEQVLIGP